ncbi:MAG: ABC transporter ATP-binding protein [Planctomycetota bacterium]
MSNHPIEFDRLTCYYGKHKAVDTLNLNIPEGQVTALLGRNGAGKTSAIRCLLGFQEPTRGTARLLGHDVRALPYEVRGRVGYVAEAERLIPWMRVCDIVAYQRATFPTFDADYCDQQMRRLQLPRRRRIGKLSRGMRAQLALLLALAPRPELLVLDDPALGLDAAVRREFLEAMIDMIADEGRTVLFTSHIISDVERVADRVAILDQSVLRVDAPLDELKSRVRRWRAEFDGPPPSPPPLPGLIRSRPSTNGLWLTATSSAESVRGAFQELGATTVVDEPLALEDLFIDLTHPQEAATCDR